ncbi:hypothetical protein Daesc_003568 [Daldinia eschscholtzii]|uniref:Uncharacterized protein n=1 Tax=Daldinia eschscholtzii TaxID=292717 RepID=A0AAX6MUS3_9PEZI
MIKAVPEVENGGHSDSNGNGTTPSATTKHKRDQPPEAKQTNGPPANNHGHIRAVHPRACKRRITRLTAKIAVGAFVVEAGGFAAGACWEPARVGDPHRVDVAARMERPLFRSFADGVEELMRVHLYPVAERMSAGRYWKLSLMARDPAVEYVPGAGSYIKPLTVIIPVRAVMVPFMEKFTSDQNEGGAMPVWLEAGSERARDVYAHFGFREVGEVVTGGVKTWGMIYTGTIDLEKKDMKTG